MNRAMFSSMRIHWRTPKALYQALDAEFGFVDDPCPLAGDLNGLMREWQSPCFVNPPYRETSAWAEKAFLEWTAGKTVVMLVASRTDTRWWHRYAMRATEIRFIRGRVKFGDAKFGAPFPSAIVIFRHPAPASTTPSPLVS